MYLLACGFAVAKLASHDPRHEERNRRTPRVGGIGGVVHVQALIPVSRIDQHQARDLVREVTGEVLHVQAAEGMPDQHIRRQQVPPLELGAQLANYGGCITWAERGIAAIVACPVVSDRAAAAGGYLWLYFRPDVQGIAQPGLENHGACAVAFDLHAMMELVRGNGHDAGGDRGHQERIELH